MNMGGDADPALADLPLSDPRCVDESCLAFKAAEHASQAATPWMLQFEYGHWVTWYYIIFVFLFMLLFIYQRWSSRRPQTTSSPRPTLLEKSLAGWRALCYRRYSGRVADVLGLPSVGLQLFLLAAVVFAVALTFAVKPYYRERTGYGSPPIAIRTGLMATALTPIIVALAGKVNLVTIFTGISYEKLNVVHRWISWICFALALVHTIPFFVSYANEGGRSMVYEQFYMEASYLYTGVPPLAMLFFLSAFSIPLVRARVYELFVHSHILAAIAYLGLMFWHTTDTNDSWVYLWATVAIWLFSLFGRVFYKSSALSLRRPWFEGFPATAHNLTGDMLKLQVFVPSTYTWRPGQHSFLRIPRLSLLDNHPFTIASAPADPVLDEKSSDGNNLVFLVRPHKGFTQRLSVYTKTNTDISLSVLVDGPYGGLSKKLENTYDSIILVAGGGGITASVSWLLYLAKCMKAGHAAVTHVKLVWVVRHKAHLLWVEEELNAAQAIAPPGSISYEFYNTDAADGDVQIEKLDKHDKDVEVTLSQQRSGSFASAPVHRGRPLLTDRLPQLLEAPRTCVLGCGPESMKIDLSNGVAKAQQKVWRGELREVALHTETFGW